MIPPGGCILFDFFGTLVEYSASRTEQGYPRSFALLREAGSDLDYEGFLALWSEVSAGFDESTERSHLEFSMSDVAGAILRRAVGPPDDGLVRELARIYVSEWNTGVRYLDGIAEMLERLKKRFELAVITNTHDPALVPDHLEGMGVSHLFRRVVTSVEFGTRKPAPDIFRHALSLLDVAAERCVYVGDNYEADYLGARAAGIRTLLIDPAGNAPVPGEARLPSIFDLEDRLLVT